MEEKYPIDRMIDLLQTDFQDLLDNELFLGTVRTVALISFLLGRLSK